MSLFDDPAVTFRLVAAGAGAGIFFMTLRHLAMWRWYSPDGVYPWRLLDERPRAWRERVASRLLEHPGLTAILFMRGAAAAWTAAAALIGPSGAAPVTLLVVTSLLKQWRLRLISEEAEVMNLMILIPLLFHAWRPDDSLVAVAGLWFIGAQVSLAYLGAGLSKLSSTSWRSGVALTRIVDSSLLRNPRMARVLSERRWLGHLLCWGTIGLELLFPLALVLPPLGLAVLLAAGVVFHLSIAVAFGLGSFLWAFLATYPALVFVNRWMSVRL